MGTRSQFEVVEVRGNIVFIVDKDQGMSVTNDAENVVANLNRQYPGCQIIYRDTDGRWDELRHDHGKFVGYAPYEGVVPNA